jgi:signal transduction histidine kinase
MAEREQPIESSPRKSRDRSRLRSLAWFFVAAVLLPVVILSGLAVRSASREEAFIERELDATLSAELSLVNSRVVQTMQDLADSLSATLDAAAAKSPDRFAAKCRTDSLPLSVPFIFDRKGSFLWPLETQSTSGSPQREFLDFNLAFFTDRTTIEVYQSIPVQYASKASVSIPQDSRYSLSQDQYALKSSVPPSKISTKKSFSFDELQAKSRFEQNVAVQQQAYDFIQKSGKQLASRNVKYKEQAEQGVEVKAVKSLYTTESLRFSQIIAGKTSGIIPRLVDDRMMLLFWKKIDEKHIAGGTIDLERLKERLRQTLPQVATRARILTILDQRGEPIARPETKNQPQWKHPFTARELGELLPRWEAAAYLADPQAVQDRARTTALAVLALVGILLVAILFGSAWVLRAVRSELIDAQHKTTFVANVSHELKTPLTSIRLFAELLKEGRQTDPAKQQKYLGIIVSEVERLTRLINNVLDFSRARKRGRSYDRRSVDLAALCREIVETQRVRLEHNGFSLHLSAPEVPVMVKADAEALKQALLNVLTNAEKYSGDEKWIALAVAAGETTATITVDDHGIGIAPHLREAVFREFYRVDDSLTTRVQGSGLGLTITRQILRDHGGDIVCSGAPPRGARFTLTLPLSKESFE